MRTIKLLVGHSSSLLLFMAALCLLLMMFNIIADILLRTIWGITVPGTAEISASYYMVGAVFLPLPLVELRNESIRVELFYNRSSRLVKILMIKFSYLAQIIFFIIIAWQTGEDAMDSFAKSEFIESNIKIFVWPSRFFLPLGFSFAALVSLLKLIEPLSEVNIYKSSQSNSIGS